MISSARFSACGLYRYELERHWGDGPLWMFLMLNPSTADETVNDPTVERCQRRATAAGAGGLLVGNLFALRSTDPRGLYTCADPVGPENDAALLAMGARADAIVLAWGVHGALRERGYEVCRLLVRAGLGHKLHALGITKDGAPRHPLYLPYTAAPVRFSVV